MNILILRWLRWLVLFFALCILPVLLSGCFYPGGGYEYDNGGIGANYYEPSGFVDYGNWGRGYQVAPLRGGYHRPSGGGGHASGRAYKSAPASRSMPSIPSHSRSGGSRSR